MAKQGRPRAQMLNPSAVEDRLRALNMTKAALCDRVGITPGQLGDALGDSRRKGISGEVIAEMALVLDCSPESIAPELSGRFTGIRPSDPVPVPA